LGFAVCWWAGRGLTRCEAATQVGREPLAAMSCHMGSHSTASRTGSSTAFHRRPPTTGGQTRGSYHWKRLRARRGWVAGSCCPSPSESKGDSMGSRLLPSAGGGSGGQPGSGAQDHRHGSAWDQRLSPGSSEAPWHQKRLGPHSSEAPWLRRTHSLRAPWERRTPEPHSSEAPWRAVPAPPSAQGAEQSAPHSPPTEVLGPHPIQAATGSQRRRDPLRWSVERTGKGDSALLAAWRACRTQVLQHGQSLAAVQERFAASHPSFRVHWLVVRQVGARPAARSGEESLCFFLPSMLPTFLTTIEGRPLLCPPCGF